MSKHLKAKILDVEMALTDPARVFGEPDEVLECDFLTRNQKIEILRRWEMDARLLAVAEEEGMTGGESNKLEAVGKALLAIGEGKGRDAEAGAPSKIGS